MKLLIAMLILFMAAAGGLAEEEEQDNKLFSFGVDTVSDVFSIRSFNGSFNDDDEEGKGETGNPLIPPHNPFPYQGGAETRLFQPPAYGNGLDIWVKFNFETEKFGTLLKLSAYGTGINDIHLSEWNGWFTLGPWFDDNISLRILAGNIGPYGSIPAYHVSDSPLLYKKNSMGVVIPSGTMTSRYHARNVVYITETNFPYGYWRPGVPTGYAEFNTVDTLNVFSPAGNIIDQSREILEQYPAGILFDINTKPVTFTLAMGNLVEMMGRPFASALESYWSFNQTGRYDPHGDNLLLDRNLSVVFRAESARIMDLFMVSAVYKYREMGMTKKSGPAGTFFHAIDTKGQTHEFGIFFNVDELPFFPALGVTLGYSGLYEVWNTSVLNDLRSANFPGNAAEKELLWWAQWKKAELPFYNGIDLRLHYNGIENLGISFNNNVTFASVNGFNENLVTHSNDPDFRTGDLYRPAWIYEYWLVDNDNLSERYFGLNNVLGASYQVNETLIVDLQIANQLGLFTLKQGKTTVATAIINRFEIYGGAGLHFAYGKHFNAKLTGGLLFALNTFSYEEPEFRARSNAGYVDFAIPLGIHVSY
ncbi:MAG: hypothetical protein FWG89_03280 [Treponema sp.]|nr:hypothetical protein [Treponema sp.]